jgi:hypothetical protein
VLNMNLPSDARIFSPVPDGSVWVKPDTVGQRYARMCARLGWDMHLHQLRHYSATELAVGQAAADGLVSSHGPAPSGHPLASARLLAVVPGPTSEGLAKPPGWPGP